MAEDSQGRLWRDASFGGAQTRQKCSRERRVCGSRARVARTVMEIRASLTSSRPGDHCDVDGLWGAGGEGWEAAVGGARPKGILSQIMALMRRSPVRPQGLGPQPGLGNTVSWPMSATRGRVQRPLRCQCRLSPVETLHSDGTTNAITSSLVRRECRERAGCANSLVHCARQPPHPVGFLGEAGRLGTA